MIFSLGNYIIGGGTKFQENPGIEIELYRLIATELNLNIKFKRIPWKSCLDKIERNQVDGIFPASFKPSRQKIGVYPMKNNLIDPDRRTRNNAYYLYKIKSSSIFWDGNTFQNVTGAIGVPMGWAVVDDLKKLGFSMKEVPLHNNSPDLLLHNRLKGFICLETVFDSYLNRRQEKFKDIVKDSKPIWEKPYYLMLSHKFVKKRPYLAQKIWDTILTIKQSKEFSIIVDKYIK